MSSKILPLSEPVRSQLRSGVSITSVGQCVEELVLNSLDAEATCIAVRIDLSIFRIQVVDNGHGISHKNLKVLGNRHSTSKCHTLEDLTNNLSHYGFRGEALASIVDMAAIVDVTTRSRSSTDTYTKLFMYGNEKSISLAESQRPSTGTTITIQDFMYNMPVRRKLIKEAIDIENIRVRLESFALMHRHVSFSLRNDSNNDKIFQASKSNGLISTFLQLFGSERAQGLAEVSHSVDHFSVSGYVSTQPHVTKSLQFVYVNRRVVLKTKIHKFMNELLSRSSIISNRLHPTTPAPGKTPSSPFKGLRLYGIFVINIECPLSEYDICLEPQKTVVEFKDWDKLLLCIEEMIVNFIQEEGLVISLDERFRRSGREQVEEESFVPHSSQAFLQVFSRKRTADTEVGDDPPKEKYGRTFCVEDNLSGLHSLPVRRCGNKKESQISLGEPSQDDVDGITPIASDCGDNGNHYLVKIQHVGSSNNNLRQDPQKLEDCPGKINTEKTDVKNLNIIMVRGNESPVRNDQGLKNLSHVEYIKSIIAKQRRDQQELQKGSYKEIDDKMHNQGETDKHSDLSDVDFIDEGLVANFQNEGDVPVGSTSLYEREKNLDNCFVINKSPQCVEALTHVCYKTTETNKIAISEGSNEFESSFCENVSEKSSLGELKELYEEEVKKMCASDFFSTPEQDVRKTPSSPPALKNQLLSYNSRSTSIEQSTSSSALCNKVEANEKNSLSSVLKKGMLKHQKKMTSCKYLQKFEFKKNVKNSDVKTISGKKKTGSLQPRCLHVDCKSVSCEQENCLQLVKCHTNSHLLPKALTSQKVEKETLPDQNSDSITVCTFEEPSRNIESQIHEEMSKRQVQGLKSEAKSNFENKLIRNNHEADTGLIRIPEVTGSREAQNHCNLQSLEENGTDLGTVVSDVHKCPKGNFHQDKEGTGLHNSFRFSPVLTANFNNDNHIETSECNHQLLEMGNIPQHGKAEQSSCTVSVCKDVMNENEKSTSVKSVWMPEHFKNFTTPDIHKKKMVCFSQSHVGQSFGNSVCSDPQVVGDQILTLTKNRSYESGVDSNIRKCQVTDLAFCSEVDKSKLVSLLRSPHTQPFEMNKDLSSDESKAMPCDHIATKVNIPESEIFIQKNQSIIGLGTPVLSSKDLVQKNVTKRTSDVCVKIPSALKDLNVIINNVDESETCKGIHKKVASSKVSSTQNDEITRSVVNKESALVGFPNSSEYNLLPKLSESQWQESNNACSKTTGKLFTERSGSNNFAVDGSGHHDATNFMLGSPRNHTNIDSLVKYSSFMNANYGMLPSEELQSCVSTAPEDGNCMALKSICTDDIERNENVEVPTQGEVLHSPSLHFSQLTLPSIADSKSSQTTEFSSTSEVLGITLPTISDHSQCSVSKHEETSKDTKLIKSSFEEISVKDTDKGHVLAKQKEASHEMGICLAPESSGNTGEGEFSGFNSLTIEAEKESSREKNHERAFPCESEEFLASLDISKVNFDDEDFPGSDSLITETEKKIDRKNNGLGISVNNDDVGTFCETDSLKTLRDSSDGTLSIRNIRCTEKLKIVGGWQETTDCHGKKIYFNARTGNTSYDKPIIRDMPVWNSSQSLGASILKVPLTNKPDYLPYGKYHLRQDFTLSHGYSTFISWKKRRESEKNACTKAALASSKIDCGEKPNAEITSNSSNLGSLTPASENVNGPQSVEKSGSLVEGKEILSQDPVSLPVPPLDSLLIDFEADNESVKWLVKPSSEESSESSLAEICQLLEPQNFAMDADVLHIAPCVTTGEGVSSKGAPVRIYNIVHPYKFTKKMLPSCKVLGQLDNKFIACNIEYTSQDETNSPLNLVVLFDQHAVHERVRLESIIEENLELAESGKQAIRSSMVTPPMSLTLPDDEIRLMVAYKELFFQRGLHFTKTSNSEVSFHAIPNCLVAREASVTRCRRSQTASIVVESIVRDMCHMLYTTGGVVGIIPKPLQYVMNNQACRGAVKFGDELTLTQCQEMIDSLVSCQLPFQCAHGRPSVVPVVNMTHLAKSERKEGKPNIKKLVANLPNQDSR
ncbi:LOW QUALITY PROTEIN: uncharacterized protein [Macrobrachium rosenbergii]|uniref:LOW QUALITY PROTEIN: uncharacterized protein n=1 Tax=Macrobrachium rosenbergii TaxID=79674 RepID=UPI0034D4B88A